MSNIENLFPRIMDNGKQDLYDRIKKLENENEKLKNKLNSVITDKITVLTPIPAIDCPRSEQLEEVTECQKCQFHNGAVVGENTDKNLYGRVFCAYKEYCHVGMW